MNTVYFVVMNIKANNSQKLIVYIYFMISLNASDIMDSFILEPQK